MRMRIQRGFEQVKDILPFLDKGYIVGGFARWMCSNADQPAPANDIDIFVPNQTTFNKVCTALRYLGYEFTNDGTFAITFQRDVFNVNLDATLPKPVQVIKPMEGVDTIEKLIDTHDFTVTMAYIEKGSGTDPSDLEEYHINVDSRFDEDERHKELIIHSVNNPIKIINRIIKYSGKRYTISVAEIKKVLDAYLDMSKSERELLKDKIESSYKGNHAEFTIL